MRVVAIVAVALALLAATAGSAAAKTASAQQGNVQATLTYGKSGASNLKIVRGGATLFDAAPKLKECGAPCGPSGFAGDPPLRVLDLDGDGEPEVVYSAYSGGAHCCTVAGIYRLNVAKTGYDRTERNFFDPGFQIRIVHGVPYLFTADDHFAYRFTAYAFSGLPLLILRFTQGRLDDRTNGFAGLLRKDARRFYRRYRHVRNRKDGTELGVIAAWAADQYRLGNRAIVLKRLRHEAHAGRLKGPDLHGKRFVRKLDGFLKRHGY